MTRLRLAELADAPLLARMEKDNIEVPWSESVIISALSHGTRIYIAYTEGEAAGYGGIALSGEQADICNIAVEKAYRKRGIGREILDCLVREAKTEGVKQLFLEVAEDNAPAIRLYAKYGFKKIAERKNYYGKKSAWILELTL